MRLSLCSRMLETERLEDVIEVAAEAGYAALELMGRDPHLGPETPRERLKELLLRLQEHGLAVSCLASYAGGFSELDSAGRQQQLEKVGRLAEMSAELGCPLLRLWAGGPEPERATPEHWQRAADGVDAAADVAACFGVRVGIELHYGYLHRDLAGVDRLLQLVASANVGVIDDPANLYVAGDDCGPSAVRHLGQRLLHVHVKDCDRAEVAGPGVLGTPPYLYRPRLLGEGALDYAPIVAALRDMGYDGYLSAETRLPLGDGATLARHERQAMARLLADVSPGQDVRGATIVGMGEAREDP